MNNDKCEFCGKTKGENGKIYTAGTVCEGHWLPQKNQLAAILERVGKMRRGERPELAELNKYQFLFNRGFNVAIDDVEALLREELNQK